MYYNIYFSNVIIIGVRSYLVYYKCCDLYVIYCCNNYVIIIGIVIKVIY